MVRRRLSLLVALLFIAAPLSATVCDAVCAEARQPAAAEHSTHHHGGKLVQPSADGAFADSDVRSCELLQAVVTDSRHTLKAPAAASLVKSANVLPLDTPAARWIVDLSHVPPPPLRAAAPLRI